MSSLPGNPADRPNPGQTIVIEKRDKTGCLRWFLAPLLFVSLMLNCGFMATQSRDPAPEAPGIVRRGVDHRPA